MTILTGQGQGPLEVISGLLAAGQAGSATPRLTSVWTSVSRPPVSRHRAMGRRPWP